MAATVQIVGYYGGVKTALTTQRYNTSDQRDPGLATPNIVPGTGLTNRSYWVFTGMEITGGDFSQITNLRWGTSGSAVADWGLGSGYRQVALKDAGDHGIPVASIVDAAGVQGSYGYDIKDAVNGIPFYSGETAACADADVYTTLNPLIFDTTVYTEAGVSKLVTHQLVLKDDTEFGEKAQLTDFVRWQEI